jgi:hypothetical protein
MNLTRYVLVALVLGTGAACLAQADARPRSPKHAVNAPRHVGERHLPGVGKVQGTASRGAPLLRRNAIGAAIQPVGINPRPTVPSTIPGANAAAKANAIGARAGVTGFASPPPVGAGRIAPAASPPAGVHPAAPAFSAHGAGISGTGMIRPGTTPGVLGGPAKLAGGINGTGMKTKR